MTVDIERELAWAQVRECADRVRALPHVDRFWAMVRVYVAARRARGHE